jgi:hypothetical protein
MKSQNLGMSAAYCTLSLLWNKIIFHSVEYAYNKYREMGLNAHQAQGRMDHKDAGHIIAKNCGGKNTATNYMWEDRHDNRAHGDDKIKKQELKRGGRL